MAVPTLIYCAGGNPTFRRIARECGWENGARLPDTVYELPLYFADQNYHRPIRQEYMAALARYKPFMATVLDWERPEQATEILEWAEEAAGHSQRIVIIPKVSGTLDDIPQTIGSAPVVLGYSVPTSYGGTNIPLWEFGQRQVHLLGGSPQAQMELADYLHVVSVDGSMAQQQANRCRFWSRRKGRKGHWIQLSEVGDCRTENAHHECFRRSLLEIREAWMRRNMYEQKLVTWGG